MGCFPFLFLPMLSPSENPHCIGHDSLLRLFSAAHSQGRVPHAFLLVGPMGVGKRTFAFRCIRQLLGHKEEQDAAFLTPLLQTAEDAGDILSPFRDSFFQTVASMAHPDLFVLNDHSLASVRMLRNFLQKTPSHTGAFRCVLVSECHTMSPNAQNALLKSLEEPPHRCVFFLTAVQSAGVLQTVSSRCQKLFLRPLKEAAFERAFEKMLSQKGFEDMREALEGDDSPSITQLFLLSSGCLGKGLRLLSDVESTLWHTWQTILRHGLLPPEHRSYKPPFGLEMQSFWQEASLGFLHQGIKQYVETLCIKSAVGAPMDPFEQVTYKRLSIEGWSRFLENIAALFTKGQTFNLKASGLAPQLFNLKPYVSV